jgi:hypothetical protein
MVRNPHNIEGRVAEAVRAAVSRERGIPVSETESAADPMDDSRIGPDRFYRIIVDVEQALGIEVSEGNWEFDAGTVNGLVSYYVEILRKRTETQQSNKVKPDSTTD